MIKTVTISDKDYYVSFGNAALVAFEEKTGDSIATIGEGTTYAKMMRLIYFGLQDGARKAKKDFDLTFEDVCDLMDEDPDSLENMMKVFEKSTPIADEKKAKPSKEAAT